MYPRKYIYLSQFAPRPHENNNRFPSFALVIKKIIKQIPISQKWKFWCLRHLRWESLKLGGEIKLPSELNPIMKKPDEIGNEIRFFFGVVVLDVLNSNRSLQFFWSHATQV